MSLWAACLARGSLTLATDSATTLLDSSGTPRQVSREKLWKCQHNMWIAAAGTLLGLPPPPGPWPSQRPSIPQSFEQSAHALDERMREGEFTAGPLYDLACIASSKDGGLKLAKISNRSGVQIANPPAVFLGGLAGWLPIPQPESIPSMPAHCRDLVVALAARTLRQRGTDEDPVWGRSIAWPLYVYQWRLDGTLAAELVQEADGASAERRDFANSVVARSTKGISDGVYAQVMAAFDQTAGFPDDVADVSIKAAAVTVSFRVPPPNPAPPVGDAVTQENPNAG